MTVEIWKAIPGFEGSYEVSTYGGVRSLDRIMWQSFGKGQTPEQTSPRRKAGRILRPGLSSNGYLTVVLKGNSYPVQWLVAAAFIGPRPDGLMVLHSDGNRKNNCHSNLRYGTALENAADMVAHGHKARGSQYASAKLHEWTASVVRALRGVWSQSELAMLFDVSPAAIQAVHDGRTWRHAPALEQDIALDWFWTFGPAGTEAVTADLKWNADRELHRRLAAI